MRFAAKPSVGVRLHDHVKASAPKPMNAPASTASRSIRGSGSRALTTPTRSTRSLISCGEKASKPYSGGAAAGGVAALGCPRMSGSDMRAILRPDAPGAHSPPRPGAPRTRARRGPSPTDPHRDVREEAACSTTSASTAPNSARGPCTTGVSPACRPSSWRRSSRIFFLSYAAADLEGPSRRRRALSGRADHRRGPHRRARALPRRRRRLQGREEEVPRRFMMLGVGATSAMYFIGQGRREPRLRSSSSLARRRDGEHHVLRIAPAAHRERGGDGPRLDRRLRARLRRRRCAARARPR
jgi:hypothetical protein